MEKFIRNILSFSTLLFLIFIVWDMLAISYQLPAISSRKSSKLQLLESSNPPDTAKPDSIKLRYPIKQKEPYVPSSGGDESPLYLHTPKNVTNDVEYDPKTNEYIIKNKINNFDFTPPDYIPFKDYLNYDIDKSLKNYWKERSEAQSMTAEKGLIPKIKIGGEVFDRIFGGSTIDIRPQGSAELTFGVISNRRDDPQLNVKQRRITNFDFQEKIQMSVTAKIGDKINLGVNYNTEASFDFENKMKLAYEGKEDEIIKTIEAGNITMPLNTTLITGSQSLFGFKTKLQFGKVFVTGIFSEQQSKAETINVTGGAQVSDFTLKADQYEENRHYLLAHYFRDNYAKGLASLPLVNSNITITKIEVWVSSESIGSTNVDNRDMVALADLGEEKTENLSNQKLVAVKNSKYPDNFLANNLLSVVNVNTLRNKDAISTYLKGLGFNSGEDFEKLENARRLNTNEYTFNSALGFISLNTQLNSSQVLAVAFQYKVLGSDKVYQVGEFADGGIAGPSCLVVKLLKCTNPNNQKPMWDLMMKNIYSLGAYQVNKDKFLLNILYTDNNIGVPTGFLNETRIKGVPLITVMGLDRLDLQLNNVPDGVFDFVDNAALNGGTIQASNGRIYFPVLEPFGITVRNAIDTTKGKNPTIKALADKYSYDELYRLTKVGAQQVPEKNKYTIQGKYKSVGGSEINLNAMSIPQGSVKVTAGSTVLVENQDYTVDYQLGRVKIINEGYLNSGTPIQISLENNSMFSIQKKTLLGTRVEYVANKDLTVGGTMLHLNERPLTQKISFGEEPISNTIWGMDVNYQKETNFITKLIDKLPFYNTKTSSRVQLSGEFANLVPGHSKAIGKTGTSYIDDFEGSTSGIDLKTQGAWKLASTPSEQPDLFPEVGIKNTLSYGFNRAKLAWYQIDPIFQIMSTVTPQHIKDDKNQQSNHFVRLVQETEVFPNKQTPNGQPVQIPTFDLSYYPEERGPYNYDVAPTALSAGIDNSGKLLNPETRWGGIMRNMSTTDFESANIEYIQFWIMDPFVYENGQNGQPLHSGGELYFDLGEISEDILKDGKKSVENGLPVPGLNTLVDTTIWGIVPRYQVLTNSFNNNGDFRKFQDVGLDGLSDEAEGKFFEDTYINKIASALGNTSEAYKLAVNDPSADDYHHYLGSDFDNNKESILNRYKRYNDVEGNSPITTGVTSTSATNLPDIEDINKDNTLNVDESYFQYKIKLTPGDMKIGQNFIADDYIAHNVQLRNGTTANVHWYQFKIPIRDYEKVVGKIQDFKSIRFMRMFFRGFREPVHCRFATFELIRSEWRKYAYDLLSPGEYVPNDDVNNTSFTLSSVNIEENGSRPNIPYVIPPGIEREINWGTSNLQQLNEQSLDIKVCNLIDGDAKAVYKTAELDVRKYKRFKMYVHLEKQEINDLLKNGDLTAFVRFGTDFTDNYYEYEIPLTVTPTKTNDPSLIWPDANDFNVEFDKLVQTKQDRNIKMRDANSSVTLTKPFIEYDGNNKITVVGVPNLSSVKTIMIGVRNPKKITIDAVDDGLPKCAEFWFDEFRLSDFDEKGGWAATARVNTTLADLGNLTIAGSISTPNFGSIEQKINGRQKEGIKQFDVATNLELGKFLPEKLGIKIPMHFDYGKIVSTPQYSPLNPDILFKDDLQSQEDKTNFKAQSQDVTTRKNLNFTNIKKVKTGSATSKPHIYDIENLDFTYAYSELDHHDADVAYDLEKTYKIALGYNFVANPKKISPFTKVKFLSRSKYFTLIKDFNIYLLPKMLTFRTDFDREYTESLLRNKTDYDITLLPTYTKIYNWNRVYGLKYDISQSLKLDFSANAALLIDEPQGAVSHYDSEDRNKIRSNILDFGRMNNYNQKITVNYNIPINKIPLFDWITANAVYSGEYRWTSPPKSIIDSVGDIIENGNNKQLIINANLGNLYNRIPYLKELLMTDKDKAKKNFRSRPEDKYKNEIAVKNKKKLPPKKSDGKKLKDKNGNEIAADSVETPPVNYFKIALNTGLRILTSVKTLALNYTETNGTIFPGFRETGSHLLLGQDWSTMAPGMGFVFGDQRDIRNNAFSKDWMLNSELINTPYMVKTSQTLSFKATLEPFPDLRIEVSATRNKSSLIKSYLRFDSINPGGRNPLSGNYYDEFSRIDNGNFTMSYITWSTAFIRDNKDYSNKIFQNFIQYTWQVANSLAKKRNGGSLVGINYSDSTTFIPDPNDNSKLKGVHYPDGFGITSQSVLLPAFLAAYTGRNPNKTSSMFPAIPYPNWRLTYTGLSKMEFLKRYFESVTIGHSYQSTYSIGSYTTNAYFKQNIEIRDLLNNFIPELDLGQITISEQFAPLINIDMVWANSLLSKIEIRKTRNLALSFANNQITEVRTSDIIIQLGYKIKDVVFFVKGMNAGSKKKKLKSDINLKADVSIKNTRTVLRKVVENTQDISAGQQVISVATSADYQLSDRFTIRAFFEKTITNPFVSNLFPSSTTNGGISLRFTLAQ